MTHQNPYRVTAPDGRVALVFGNINDGVPMPVMARCGGAKGLLRFAGSTSNATSADNQAALRQFMESVFFGLQMQNVVLMSGATRVLDAGYQTVMTVLELPTLVRSWNPTCRTLGSAPRTTPTMSLVEDSRFVPSDQVDATTLIHPGLDVAWIVQVNASTTIDDYGLDVPVYLDLMDDLRGDIGDEKMATGLIVWGGGEVTAREVRDAIQRRHPVAIVANSGRFADSLVNWRLHRTSNIDPNFLAILNQWHEDNVDYLAPRIITSPQQLRDWLRINRFLG